jgi:hypothetical protein
VELQQWEFDCEQDMEYKFKRRRAVVTFVAAGLNARAEDGIFLEELERSALVSGGTTEHGAGEVL